MSGLHLHHTGEDDLLWPLVLTRSTPAADLVARMQAQHSEIEALLPHRKKRFAYPRALYGLDDPFTGRAGVTAAEAWSSAAFATPASSARQSGSSG